jgi:hypothetical protein
MFFFEERTKKLLRTGLSLPGQAEAKMIKSFLLLFFKKEGLASARHPAKSAGRNQVVWAETPARRIAAD